MLSLSVIPSVYKRSLMFSWSYLIQFDTYTLPLLGLQLLLSITLNRVISVV